MEDWINRNRTSIRNLSLLLTVFSLLYFLIFPWIYASYLGDPILDYGAELYLFWRFSSDAVLYRDLDYLYGPIPILLNSLFYSFAGREGVIAINALGSLAVLIALWRFLRKYSSEAVASICVFSCVFFFATNYMTFAGNYNFFTPYKTAALWGLLFASASVLSIGFVLNGKSNKLFCLSGMFFCFTFLSKQEHFAALAVGIFCFFLFSLKSKRVKEDLAYFSLGALATLTIVLISFHIYSGSSVLQILSWISRLYTAIFSTNITQQKLYHSMFGFPAGMGLVSYALLLLFFPLAITLGHRVARNHEKNLLIVSLFLLFTLPLLLFLSEDLVYRIILTTKIYLALPILLFSALIGYLLMKRKSLFSERSAFEIGATAFSIFLCAKILFSYQLSHYGFSLGPPAFICLVLYIYAFTKNQKKDKELQFVSSSFLIFVSILLTQGIAHQKAGIQLRNLKPVKMRVQETSFHTDKETALVLFKVTQELKRNLADSKATLTVLPEGNFYNWILQRKSPLRFLSLYPDQFILNTEQEILQQMQDQPGDFILFNQRDLKEYGYDSFENNYGKNITAWVKSKYIPVQISDENKQMFSDLGISLWRRNF